MLAGLLSMVQRSLQGDQNLSVTRLHVYVSRSFDTVLQLLFVSISSSYSRPEVFDDLFAYLAQYEDEVRGRLL